MSRKEWVSEAEAGGYGFADSLYSRGGNFWKMVGGSFTVPFLAEAVLAQA